MDILFPIIKVILLFGVTIFVHELGHFLVARWCGLKIEVFSIGFGPSLWQREVNGVIYKIGVLPLGGYVALPQMDPGDGLKETEEGKPSLPPIKPWKKILVAFAGVTCNMILAYALAWVVFGFGKSYAPVEEGCVIGYIETNTVAHAQGLKAGEKVVSVQGVRKGDQREEGKLTRVNSWEEFALGVAFHDEVALTILNAEGVEREVLLETEPFMGSKRVTGIAPLNYCYVLQVGPGTSAEEAGLEAGDKIVALDGQRLYSRTQLTTMVNERANQSISIKFEREGELIESTVRPKYNETEKRALIGISFNTLDVRKPWDQVKSHASLIFRLLAKLVSPADAKQAVGSVGGPVAIFTMFWYAVKSDIIIALWFTGLLNVNLAVLNLLPIPILDGGHIVFACLEAIRRKPLSARFVNALSNVFMILFLSLFMLLTNNDSKRIPLLSKFYNATPAEEVEATNQADAVEAPVTP